MSTRGAIAYSIGHGDAWQGVYIHQDGYPTGLGARVWRNLQETFRGDARRFIAQRITAHAGGYSDFPGDCYCHGWQDFELAVVTPTSAHGHIEWVYVVGALDSILTVYRGVEGDAQTDRGRWATAGTFSIWGAEPNWKRVEREPVVLPSEVSRSSYAAP